MIYSLEKQDYPSKNQSLEIIRVEDKNGLPWELRRVKEGVFVRYMGDRYFIEKYFTFTLTTESGQETHKTIKNHNTLFFKGRGFEFYYRIRNIITDSYTDDIYEDFSDMFAARLSDNMFLLTTENNDS